jgi:hypothetical protein
MAVLMVLVAMILLGLTASAVHFAALRASRDSADALRRTQALAAAEYGLYHALVPTQWQSRWNTTSTRGLLATRVHRLPDGLVDTVRVWKLDDGSFLLTSEATMGAGPLRARRRLGLLVAPVAPTLAPLAAVTAREQVSLTGGAAISGTDVPVPRWPCPPPADALPAVAVADRAMVTASECGAAPCLSGSTDVLTTPRAGEADMLEYVGGTARSELAARGVPLSHGATIHVPNPSLDAHGACDTTNSRNLGDPLRPLGELSPCADYFFLGHASGDLRISGGTGQLLLFVEGDLTLDAGTRLFGVALVRGTLRLLGGAQFTGAVLASRVTLGAGSRIDYSRCALTHAMRAAAVPAVPPGPSWVELY